MGKALKVAIPTAALAGGWVALGYQVMMILTGIGMLLEHRFQHGKWWDKKTIICHGKLGVTLLVAGCLVTVAGHIL